MSTWMKAVLAVAFVAALTAVGCAVVFAPRRDEVWVLMFVVVSVVAAVSRRGSWNGWRFGVLGSMGFGATLWFVGAAYYGALVGSEFGADGWNSIDVVLFLMGVVPFATLGGVFTYGAVKAATYVDEDDGADDEVTTDVRA